MSHELGIGNVARKIQTAMDGFHQHSAANELDTAHPLHAIGTERKRGKAKNKTTWWMFTTSVGRPWTMTQEVSVMN